MGAIARSKSFRDSIFFEATSRTLCLSFRSSGPLMGDGSETSAPAPVFGDRTRALETLVIVFFVDHSLALIALTRFEVRASSGRVKWRSKGSVASSSSSSSLSASSPSRAAASSSASSTWSRSLPSSSSSSPPSLSAGFWASLDGASTAAAPLSSFRRLGFRSGSSLNPCNRAMYGRAGFEGCSSSSSSSSSSSEPDSSSSSSSCSDPDISSIDSSSEDLGQS